MILNEFNRVIDPLYGPISLDPYLCELILQPEVQRLREVRLSNINSFLITGISNLSRFEHSLGTAFLAQKLSQKLRLSKKDAYVFMTASLLHDVSITPFGHLMEEGFRYAGIPYDHEGRLYDIIIGDDEVGDLDFQIYRGKTIGFKKVLNRKLYNRLNIKVSEIFACIKGKNLLGTLLNGTIDIDNIDNVCRMAYHLGLPFRKELPLEIIDNFSIRDNKIYFSKKNRNLLSEWSNLRERLYNILMTNPFDFVAKSMLIEAIRLALVGDEENESILEISDWRLTDLELINRLQSYTPTKEIIQKLYTGKFYNLIGLFWVNADHLLPKGTEINEIRTSLAEEAKVKFADLVIYVIKDKRYRRLGNINFLDDSNDEEEMAENDNFKATNNILIGISSPVEEINTKVYRDLFRNKLKLIFQDNRIEDCDSEKHIIEAFDGSFFGKKIKQETLF